MNFINRKYKLCLIGTYPQPTHGLSVINEAMKDEFIKARLKPLILNTSSKSLNRSFFIILLRFLKLILIMTKFSFYIVKYKFDYIYIGLSGGLGQIYDLFFIVVGMLFNSKIYVHHHSFAYLNNKSILTNLIVNTLKNSATHIVLCDTMKEKLCKYKKDINIKVLSNAAFINSPNIIEAKNIGKHIKLGFLSNITFEKGIKEYFEVIKNLLNEGYSLKGLLAGSIFNLKTKKYLKSKLKEFKDIHFFGKIEGLEKENFLNEINVLLIPTKYKNEAEPLVIHEAMSHGVVVIAWDNGCIKDIILKNTGIIIEKDKQYVTNAIHHIINWINNPKKLTIISKKASQQFNNQKSKHLIQLNKIISDISSTN